MSIAPINEVTRTPPLFQYKDFLLRPFFEDGHLFWGLRHSDGGEVSDDERAELTEVCKFISMGAQGNA